jgi:hypothetical protein
MKMKERSTDGNMYLGGRLGREIRTGLSRLSGGLWYGSLVYRCTGTSAKAMGLFMPGKSTRTCIFPRSWVVEKERIGGDDFGMETLGWLADGFGMETLGWLVWGPARRDEGAPPLVAGSSSVSWRSWDHFELEGSCGGPLGC